MAEVIRRDQLHGGPHHRADEIHIHHRERKRSWWPLALAGLLALALFALWSFARNRRAEVAAPAIAPAERIEPGIQPPRAPEAPKAPVVPAPVPEPESARPELPGGVVGADAGAAPSAEPGAQASGETCVLQAITFAPNETAIRDDHEEVLRVFAACVKDKPDQNVTLEGRADPRGNADYNQGLAKRRAESVKRALEAQGVPTTS
jgi:peptidoglycan-associated lipoprotein